MSAVATLSDPTTRSATSPGWFVADPRVGTVDGRGLVTAHDCGRTTVYARDREGTSLASTLVVAVRDALRKPLSGVVRWSAFATPWPGCRYRVAGVVPESECQLAVRAESSAQYAITFREPR